MKTDRTILTLFIYALSIAACPAQIIYQVSPDGRSDKADKQATIFRSIYEALDKAAEDTNNVTIYLRSGKYVLDRPLTLTAAHGNNHKALTIKSYPGEKATLSGGRVLKLKWKKYRGGIMRAAVGGKPAMDMLVVNGTIRQMARYPNYDPKAVRFNGTSAQATAPERVRSWKNPEGGFLHAMHRHDWGDFHYRITGKTAEGKLALEGGWQNNRPMGLSDENRMVENIFEELDAPGEWYYDPKGQQLYYYPMPGEDINTAILETPQLKNLITFEGSESNPVKNIVIEDIELTQTVRTFMEHYEPLLRSDWTIFRGGAVVFRGTENCALRDCHLHNIGGNGVFFDCYNRRSSVEGCILHDIGASAICFVGDPAGVRSPSFRYEKFVPLQDIDTHKGPLNENHPSHCYVSDNLIHNIGLFEKQITGVELSMCHNITVSHNSIYNTPRAGINISEGTWGGHIIEHNDIFNTVKETGDHGSINSWGRDRYWHPDYGTMAQIVRDNPALILADMVAPIVIRHNRIRCDRGWDIDLDDGSTNYHIYNNLCLNGGIKLREGFYRTVENNIIVNNTLHPHLWFEQCGDVFTRNIVMIDYKPIQVNSWGQMVDYNIFADSLALHAARKRGTDSHSIVTPLRFKDPQNGDFSLPDNSEAIAKGGFRNFTMTDFGVLSPALRKLAETPVMPVPVVAGGDHSDRTLTWRGAVLKSLNTPGEQSATGMDQLRGIYIVSVDALGSPVRDFLFPNDVILSINGETVDNLNDFKRIIKNTATSTKVKVTVFRRQKEETVVLPAN